MIVSPENLVLRILRPYLTGVATMKPPSPGRPGQENDHFNSGFVMLMVRDHAGEVT